MKRLEDSPFYGVLAGLRGRERAIARIFNKLQHEGYIDVEDVAFTSSAGSLVTYQALMLKDRGRQQIQSGQYLSDETS